MTRSKATRIARWSAAAIAGTALAVIASTHVDDPADSGADGKIVNDTAQIVTVEQCTDSCAADAIDDSVTLAPGQAVTVGLYAGGTSPWIVMRNGQAVGCMPNYLREPFDTASTTFRLSGAMSARSCF